MAYADVVGIRILYVQCKDIGGKKIDRDVLDDVGQEDHWRDESSQVIVRNR